MNPCLILALHLAALTVERCTVEVVGLHPDLHGLRVVQLSDFHSTRLGSLERAALDSAARLCPHLVALTGDMTTSPRVARDLSRAIAALRPPLGCFAVLGNGEYEGDAEAIVEAMRQEGIVVLRNEARLLAKGEGRLWILGVDDPSRGKSFLEGALLQQGGDTTTPRLLLAHFPTIFTQATIWGIDVVLAGHTHGGQILLPGLRLPAMGGSRESAAYLRGDFRQGHTWMHVSRGLGTSTLPLRLGAAREITLITLRRAPRGTATRPLPSPPTGP